MSPHPASFDKFMNALQAQGINGLDDFDENLAQILRMQASTKDYGAIMSSGKTALAYVPWLIDGMNMSNKLIVHLNSGDEALDAIVKASIESDIRVSSHCQNQTEFTTDISEHRMDLLLLTEDALPEISNWMKLLSDAGLLVLLASEDQREQLMQAHSDDYFLINKAQLFISRKGMQHRNKRRRGRQRKILNSV